MIIGVIFGLVFFLYIVDVLKIFYKVGAPDCVPCVIIFWISTVVGYLAITMTLLVFGPALITILFS